MSTRANIVIRDTRATLYFYRHSDGYPTVTGESLKRFVKDYGSKYRLDAMQSAGWLVLHGHKEYGPQTPPYKWKVGAYEPTDTLHGDAEYIYIIDLTARTLTCHEPKGARFWDNPTLEHTVPSTEFKPVTFGETP